MKVVMPGLLCETEEHKKQLLDGFKEEFGVDVEILGSYKTLPGHNGEGGRSDVVVEIPDGVVGKAAIHPWHLDGLFRWYDDYLAYNRDIVPEDALEKFFGEKGRRGIMVQTKPKPKCVLVGTDGNVFALAGKVGKTLKRAQMFDEAKEFYARLPQCGSYDEALQLMMEYVEVD